MLKKEFYNKKDHDPILLKTTEYENPKEYYKLIARRIDELSIKKPINLIDIACGAGGFLYYVNQYFDIKKGVGIDISDQLIEQAKLYVPKFEFFIDSVTSASVKSDELKKQFDVCTFLGSLVFFDEIDIVLSKLLSYLKDGGSLLIFDCFNDDPVDMLMRYKKVGNLVEETDWQVGFNIRSKFTVEQVIKKIEPECEVKWEDFTLPFSIPKTEDPMRAWTIETEFNKNQIVVGTGQILYHKLVHIKKKKI